MVEANATDTRNKVIKPSLNLAVIIRNWKFDIARESLIGTTATPPKDLDQKDEDGTLHQDNEVNRMEQFFREKIGATVFIKNLSERESKPMLSPHDELLHFFNHLIIHDFVEPAYKRGQYVLLHVYCTGHGYMDKKNKKSQILLNMPIFLLSETKFHNPFPIEEILYDLFQKYTNTCIVFIADICREENNFHGLKC